MPPKNKKKKDKKDTNDPQKLKVHFFPLISSNKKYK
jgi:hypothetical protein